MVSTGGNLPCGRREGGGGGAELLGSDLGHALEVTPAAQLLFTIRGAQLRHKGLLVLWDDAAQLCYLHPSQMLIQHVPAVLQRGQCMTCVTCTYSFVYSRTQMLPISNC